MKTKKFTFLFCTLCFLFAAFTLPVAAKAKSSPKKLILNRREILLYVGETKYLSVEKVRPAKASAKVTWKSKNQKTAFVSKNGKVTAKKAGKAVITAASKKNPAIKAAVKVTIKKRPKKVEKNCTFTSNSYAATLVSTLQSHDKRQYGQYGGPIIIRCKEDVDEIINLLRSYKLLTQYRLKNSFLSQCANIDFKKESLVVFSGQGFRQDILSCSTKFDSSGKLQCLLTVQVQNLTAPDSYPTLTYIPGCDVALKISRKDEAMIDYFHFETQK